MMEERELQSLTNPQQQTSKLDLEEATVTALLSHNAKSQELLPLFTEPLKNQFENRDLWLRLGLTYSLSDSPSSALQAFKECMRLDETDPLPSMLAAKLVLEDFDDPDNGLTLAEEAIKRCQHRLANKTYEQSSFYTKLLSRSYLLAGIMHAYMYEREPESMKVFKNDNLESSLSFLDKAIESNPNDHLSYFHKALHHAKHLKDYQQSIEYLRKALQSNPQHISSMQLLILSLSALRHYDQALVLCESMLHQYENNLLLLYIKCSLEQCLVDSKGYKSALETAQSMFMIGASSVWLLVAEIFLKIGSIDDAEQCIDEGASGALSHQVMYVRGLISKARNNLLEAKTLFQSCLALCPRHAKALQQLAHVHYLMGNHSTAEKFLKDSLDVDTDSDKSWHYLSLVYIELNQHDRAKECAKKAAQLEDSSPVVPISVISRLTFQ